MSFMGYRYPDSVNLANFFLVVIPFRDKCLPQQDICPMEAELHFDPTKYSETALRLILKVAEELKVTPAEAVAHLLDELATRKAA